MNLPEHFAKNIHKYISSGDSVIIALSGGPDSTALLYLLESIRKKYKLKLYAAHFNHMLRGRAGFDDAFIAKKLCKSKAIPFFYGEKDIMKISSREKGGVEKTARNERYKFLIKCAAKTGANIIAVGHNLDDNAETVMMRLISGSGSEGLSGIAGKRNIFPAEFGLELKPDGNRSFIIIRPLSGVLKKEIFEFLKTENISFSVDKTNMENMYTRNKVRNILLPLIAGQFNPRIIENLSRTGMILSAEDEYMEKTAAEAFKASVILGKKSAVINIKRLFKYHAALRRRVARMALKNIFESARKVSFESVETVLDCCMENNAAQLPEGFFCRTEKGMLEISRTKHAPFLPPEAALEAAGGHVDFNGCRFLFKTTNRIKGLLFGKPDTAYMDMDRITFPLEIRLRKPGDKFMPFGMDREVRLKKFFNTSGLKSDSPVIADFEKIIWVAGGRIDNRVKVTAGTRRVLVMNRAKISK